MKHVARTLVAMSLSAVMAAMMPCGGQSLWIRYLEVPKEYEFAPQTQMLRSYNFEKFDAELLLQKNGPNTWQRVLKV